MWPVVITSRCRKRSSYCNSRRHRSLQVRGMACALWSLDANGWQDGRYWQVKKIYNIGQVGPNKRRSWQIKSWLHTNWTWHNDRTNVTTTGCLIWWIHVTRCTTGSEAVKTVLELIPSIHWISTPIMILYINICIYNATKWGGIFAI